MEENRKRYNRIEVRFNDEEKEFVIQSAKAYKISMADYIRCACIKDVKINEELYQTVIRKSKLSHTVHDAREESFHLYFDKNALRRIIDSAKFSQYNLGKINMEEVRLIIKRYEKIYSFFPDEIKEIKKEALKELQNCNNRNYLQEKLKVTDRYLVQAEEAHILTVESTSHKNILEHTERKEQEKRGYDKDGKKIQTARRIR